MNRPIEDAWLEYARNIVPVGASPAERQALRRAFYGGAMLLSSHLFERLDPDGSPPEVEALTASIDADLQRFTADVHQFQYEQRPDVLERASSPSSSPLYFCPQITDGSKDRCNLRHVLPLDHVSSRVELRIGLWS